MKNDFRITFKQFVIISLLIVFITSIAYFAFYSSINYLQKNTDIISSITGATGNIIGGLIGGIVAYIVAAFQISSQNEIENSKHRSYISSLLILMKAEIEYNSNLIKKYKHDFNKGDHLALLNTLSTSFWERSSEKIAEKIPEKDISKFIEYSIKTNAVKNSNDTVVTLAVSDELIYTFDETIKLIDKCISELKPPPTSN